GEGHRSHYTEGITIARGGLGARYSLCADNLPISGPGDARIVFGAGVYNGRVAADAGPAAA
ncbi:MAG: hypothetical protein ACK5YX_14320, partial [Planctomyces sp.]